MSESDSQKILGWIDSALEVFRSNKGGLTAQEISLRSMLAVVRNEMADHLERSLGQGRSQPTSREFPSNE